MISKFLNISNKFIEIKFLKNYLNFQNSSIKFPLSFSKIKIRNWKGDLIFDIISNNK